MTRERLNRLIHLFGESQKASMRAERRESLKSVLFDLPRRSLLGWFALYEHEASFLRELCDHVPPDELGRRMKLPGCRPYYLQLFILMCTYLGARQQRLLDLGLAEGDPFPEEREDDLALVVDFWERATRAYRNDGLLLPIESGGTQPILDEERRAEVADALRPAGEDAVAAIRRMAATLELYNFVLHGEQRDGIFGHGPYPAGDGRIVFLKEFNDLRNDYLPWAETEARIPFPNVVVAYECHDTQVRCDMFGGLVTDPLEIDDRLDRIAVLTQDGGRVRSLSPSEIDAVQQAAAAAQVELYLKAVDWSPRYKIEYGAYLFANHLKPFFDLAGIDGDAGRRIVAACEQTAARMVDDLLAGAERGELPSIWKHMATTEGAFFWPVA
jgi:hypothetical protein